MTSSIKTKMGCVKRKKSLSTERSGGFNREIIIKWVNCVDCLNSISKVSQKEWAAKSLDLDTFLWWKPEHNESI